jgi:hypothetical protein
MNRFVLSVTTDGHFDDSSWLLKIVRDFSTCFVDAGQWMFVILTPIPGELFECILSEKLSPAHKIRIVKHDINNIARDEHLDWIEGELHSEYQILLCGWLARDEKLAASEAFKTFKGTIPKNLRAA